MANPQTMTSNQKMPVGVTILDEGGEEYPDLQVMPEGYVVTFESSDPTILGVSVRPDGLNADLSSDGIGTVQLTVMVTKPDGTPLSGTPDVTDVTVQNALPGSANVTFGAPEPEA